jgi:hypothetical protein
MMLWDHTSDELLAMPLPDLALLVLADFKQGQGGISAIGCSRRSTDMPK